MNGIVGASISPKHRKIFGRSIGYSPSDLNYLAYNADGTYAGTGETPYHGLYPGASKTWLFPDESKVVDNSGTVYTTTDLTYANSFGMTIDDIAFHGADIPIVLAGSELISYSNTLLETGRFTLKKPSKKVFVNDQKAFVFSEDGSVTNGVGVETVDFEDFSVGTPGLPVDPVGLPYTVDGSATDASGVVYLMSKAQNSIFRWDTNTQQYLSTIALPEAMNLMVYSPALDRLYLYSGNKRIYRIDLGTLPLAAVHHATTPQLITKLIPMENDLFALRNGSWDDQWIYGSDGALLNSNVDCCYHTYHFYDPGSSRLFFDHSTVNYLHDGTFGTITSHAAKYSFVPIAISPDGQFLIDQKGVVYAATAYSASATLSNDIIAAGWHRGNALFTVKKPVAGNSKTVTLQKWNGALSESQEIVIPGTFVKFHMVGDDPVPARERQRSPCAIPFRFRPRSPGSCGHSRAGSLGQILFGNSGFGHLEGCLRGGKLHRGEETQHRDGVAGNR